MSSTGKVQISAANPACGPVVRKINAETGNTRDKEKPLHQGRMDRLGAADSPVTEGFLVRMGIDACVAGLALSAESEGCAFRINTGTCSAELSGQPNHQANPHALF
jgi:hypothetical protein